MYVCKSNVVDTGKTSRVHYWPQNNRRKQNRTKLSATMLLPCFIELQTNDRSNERLRRAEQDWTERKLKKKFNNVAKSYVPSYFYCMFLLLLISISFLLVFTHTWEFTLLDFIKGLFCSQILGNICMSSRMAHILDFRCS